MACHAASPAGGTTLSPCKESTADRDTLLPNSGTLRAIEWYAGAPPGDFCDSSSPILARNLSEFATIVKTLVGGGMKLGSTTLGRTAGLTAVAASVVLTVACSGQPHTEVTPQAPTSASASLPSSTSSSSVSSTHSDPTTTGYGTGGYTRTTSSTTTTLPVPTETTTLTTTTLPSPTTTTTTAPPVPSSQAPPA